jgi:Lanthionine synthetase C-like protein
MLYRPEAFERLTDAPWDEGRVRDAVAGIVADADGAFDPDDLWPANEWDAWKASLPLTEVFAGAAGVVWALDRLRRRGHPETRLDLAAAARRVLGSWRANPDFGAGELLPSTVDASLMCAESGILTVAYQLEPSVELADDLYARVRENAWNETNELMWGAPGTMLAARGMLDWTGEERWAEAWRESAEELLRRRADDGLWTHLLYGKEAHGYLGPAHGAMGNVLAVMAGGDLLFSAERELLERETNELLRRTAVVEDGLANWPATAGRDLVANDQIRVQWCHGAPGIVTSASGYLDEDLLLAGAELTWRAGPHGDEKGASICHGTAGNGYAFLKAFGRTGDERWLDRARRFAVHALGQVERAREQQARGRYSLWTGDLGVALFAADCVDGTSAYPVVDGWEW